MDDARYQVLINCPGPGNPMTHLVRETASGRILGGFGANAWRSWVFPLYTPRGLTVLQEYACDHPFHNGFFVGQHPVRAGGREANLWVTPPRRTPEDPVYVNVGRMDLQGAVQWQAQQQVHFVAQSVWRDADEQPVIDERREVALRALPDATICDMFSHKRASYAPAEFPATKYGSIGVRVEPRLLPPLGGRVLAAAGGQLQRGLAEEVANGRHCDWVAYENHLPGAGPFGICLLILHNSATPGVNGPWFVRDYGLASFNPTMRQGVQLPQGSAWSIGLRAVAYDGALSLDRIEQWKNI